MSSQTVSYSRVETTHLVMPPDTNVLGKLFGGRLMEWIDVTASIAATRHCRSIVVTASMDALHFISPVNLGSYVILKAAVNYVHRTSLEVGVRIEAEDPLTGLRQHTASAYLTFVAIDSAGKPTAIPSLVLETPEDERRFEAAKLRREERLKLKQTLLQKVKTA